MFPDQAVRTRDCVEAGGLAAKVMTGWPRWRRPSLGFAPKAGVMVVVRSRRGDRVKVLFRVSHGRATGPGDHGARAGS